MSAGVSSGGADVHDVLIVGAGFGGLCAAYRLQAAGIGDFLVLDEAGGVGGTWWWNRYPGIACDIPAHFYGFSFAPNPDWSSAYPPGSEIQAYLARFVEAQGLSGRLRLGCRAERFIFEETTGFWRVATSDGETYRARHVIAATGALHEPKLLKLEGFDLFRGRHVHTARWPDDLDVSGKRVALIGSAASAIQAAPALARMGAEVAVLQRSPNYIGPRGDHSYPGWVRGLLRRAPWLISAFRLYQRTRLDRLIYPIVHGPNVFSARARNMTRSHMRRHVSDPQLREALTPDYAIGCKRMLISDDFYPALGSGSVKLIASAAARFEAGAVVAADGTRVPADIAVHATGFDLGAHYRSLDVRGPGGLKLKELWATRAEGYLGSAVAGFPNFWQVGGPNTLVGTTSVVHMHEMQVDWILRAIRLAGDGLIAPRKAVQDAWNARIQNALASTVWATGGCSSWYKRPDGRIETLYSGKAADYRRDLARCEADQFERFERPPSARPVAADMTETAA